MLFVVLVLPLIGLLPPMLGSDRAFHARDRRQARQARNDSPSLVQRAAHGAFRLSPSELHHSVGVESAVNPRAALLPLAGLAAMAFMVQLVGFVAFKRMLDMPVSLGTRRGSALGGLWDDGFRDCRRARQPSRSHSSGSRCGRRADERSWRVAAPDLHRVLA